MASALRETITGAWGQSPQQGPGVIKYGIRIPLSVSDRKSVLGIAFKSRERVISES